MALSVMDCISASLTGFVGERRCRPEGVGRPRKTGLRSREDIGKGSARHMVSELEIGRQTLSV